MGVGCKLVLVMMSTNIGKNPAVSGEGHVLTAYAVFSGGKIGQYADKARVAFKDKCVWIGV